MSYKQIWFIKVKKKKWQLWNAQSVESKSEFLLWSSEMSVPQWLNTTTNKRLFMAKGGGGRQNCTKKQSERSSKQSDVQQEATPSGTAGDHLSLSVCLSVSYKQFTWSSVWFRTRLNMKRTLQKRRTWNCYVCSSGLCYIRHDRNHFSYYRTKEGYLIGRFERNA